MKDASPPLAALVELIDGTHLAPPERLTSVVGRAGRELGVDITIFLIDFEQRTLRPIEGTSQSERRVFGVETTMPGRAYRLVRTVVSRTEGGPRLWVPLLDGVERLGVLEVIPSDPAAVDDPYLVGWCRRLSLLVGHLVTIADRYGDGFDAVRSRRRLTPATELLWALLPPLTAATDSFMLSGVLEPCYEVGGDAFDYSLSERSASLAIFDPVGHTLGSGLIAAVALSAYRSCRRFGGDLAEQVSSIDDNIGAQFSSGAFATGVLAELDLDTGRLRYVNAGHPQPLIMRGGKVVKPLTGGLRRPFGLGDPECPIVEESLEPQDWLVMYTDGIVEAKDEAGDRFGVDRLVDFLRREAASQHPPPETARRLIHSVLAHQLGMLQDDATMLLARWGSPDELSP